MAEIVFNGNEKMIHLHPYKQGTEEVTVTPMDRVSKESFDNEITRELVEEFASENGVFVDSLINNINEKTYDLIDDNLIEEQEDTYTIEEQYYQNILK